MSEDLKSMYSFEDSSVQCALAHSFDGQYLTISKYTVFVLPCR